MGLNEVTAGMTPQEKEIYFAHMEKRHKEEAEKIQLERERTRAYKEYRHEQKRHSALSLLWW